MKDAQIHPTAIVEAGAQLGKGVIVEAYAVVKEHVCLEDDVVIKSHAYIDGYTTIGEKSVIYPSAVIGTKTQDKKFKGEKTFIYIGKRCEIREYVTINASTFEDTAVRVGDDCLIMACCHIAHNCQVGNHVIISNSSLLAGHVVIEDYAIIGGLTGVHQFSKIGCHAMVGGMSRIGNDVPPFTIGAGSPYVLAGINRVGLKRRGFSFQDRLLLAKAYKLVYRSHLSVAEALDEIEQSFPSNPYIEHFVAFCRSSRRGLIGLQKRSQMVMEESVV